MVQNGCNVPVTGDVPEVMRFALLSLFAAALAAPAAEPQILTFDPSGALRAHSPAVLRPDGHALVPRETLYGAASALLIDPAGRLHPLLWVTGEDIDAGIAEIFIGLQAPPGPDPSSLSSDQFRLAGVPVRLIPPRESGAFGLISRLESSPAAPSGPLFDEHGLLAGWHATRVIDGRTMSFAIPLARVASLHGTLHLTLAQWNALHPLAAEEPYLRALGHLWADDFHGALFYFRKSTELSPQFARAWLHLGFVEGKVGRASSRFDCYRRAIDLDPRLPEARYFLGFALMMRGDHDDAIDQLRALRKLDQALAKRLELYLRSVHVDILGTDGRLRHRTPRRL